jgi:hypothetical protein
MLKNPIDAGRIQVDDWGIDAEADFKLLMEWQARAMLRLESRPELLLGKPRRKLQKVRLPGGLPNGVPNGIRTRVASLKGWSPRPG